MSARVTRQSWLGVLELGLPVFRFRTLISGEFSPGACSAYASDAEPFVARYRQDWDCPTTREISSESKPSDPNRRQGLISVAMMAGVTAWRSTRRDVVALRAGDSFVRNASRGPTTSWIPSRDRTLGWDVPVISVLV
jgi:hypothetical protein